MIIGSSDGGAGGTGTTTPAIQNSLRFRASASAYLSRTFGSPTNNKIYTLSFWMKRGLIAQSGNICVFGAGANPQDDNFSIDGGAADKLRLKWSASALFVTSAVYRDIGAFCHIVVAVDTTQATAANRSRLYVNGTEVTAFTSTGYPVQNTVPILGSNVIHYLGTSTGAGTYYDGQMAQVCFVDGQQLTPSAFGATDATSGEWKPKTNAQIRTAVGTGGTRNQWGTNGFLLDFTNTASTTTLGYDHSQSDTDTTGNNWTCNNISLTSGVTYDALIDSPVNGSSATQPVGNYCTLNPLWKDASSSTSEANLKGTVAATAGGIAGTVGVTSGKWYFEVTCVSSWSGNNGMIGIADQTFNAWSGSTYYSQAGVWGCYGFDGKIYNNGGSVAYGSSYTNNDVIGVAIDMDNGKCYWSKNGTWMNSGDPAAQTNPGVTGLSGKTIYPLLIGANAATVSAWNFGQRPFAYTPPTGFKALCTSNLGTPAIDKPSLHFDAKTRSGTGASYSVTGLGFSPDLVWVKGRSGATDHAIYDAVRGATYQLESNTTTAETTEATGLTAFNSDGYSGGALAQMNTNLATYIDWFWNESATAGFDIVTYTGNGSNRTINHSLGAAPKMIIIMDRTTAGNSHFVYHESVGATKFLLLASTAAATTSSLVWNDTAPTSSVFSLGTSGGINLLNDNYVAYCFAEIAGFSKAFSGVGNSSADGTFVYCGFRPRFIIYKNISNVQAWCIKDTARDPYNLATQMLVPNAADAESASNNLDIVSNGFKLRANIFNNDTFVGFALAESPFQYANAR